MVNGAPKKITDFLMFYIQEGATSIPVNISTVVTSSEGEQPFDVESADNLTSDEVNIIIATLQLQAIPV